MGDYGRTRLNNLDTGRKVQVTADGAPEWAPIGVSIDWTTVAAVTTATTLTDDTVVQPGNQYLRYGQVITRITATGLYGPYDPTAGDGRQTLARGSAFIVNATTLLNPASGIGATSSNHPGVIEGGAVWKARLIATAGAHSLAAGPTFTELEAVFPRLRYVGHINNSQS